MDPEDARQLADAEAPDEEVAPRWGASKLWAFAAVILFLVVLEGGIWLVRRALGP